MYAIAKPQKKLWTGLKNTVNPSGQVSLCVERKYSSVSVSKGDRHMKKPYIYYNHEGKQVHVKDFSNISDMFHWCELNCKRIRGNYYKNGNRILCGNIQ